MISSFSSYKYTPEQKQYLCYSKCFYYELQNIELCKQKCGITNLPPLFGSFKQQITVKKDVEEKNNYDKEEILSSLPLLKDEAGKNIQPLLNIIESNLFFEGTEDEVNPRCLALCIFGNYSSP